MVTPPLRCHLLIGPPASGKSTLATELAKHTGAVVLANDAIRAELYGDAAVQGPWSAIEAVLHTRLKEAVASGQPVILDGTHSQRPWRLAILQALELPSPVQWIGWWLTTPLEHCLAWNQQRPRQVEERVIRQMVSVLPTSVHVPAAAQQKKLPTDPVQRREMLKRWQERFLDRQRSQFREEGFAAVVAIDPSAITTSLSSAIQDITSGLDFQIQMASHRTAKIEVHRYSRLLDLERLIFLIRLLLESPGVELSDPLVERELRASFRFEPNAPLPDEPVLSFATRAAYALRHRHGPCYGDENAVAEDLHWLLKQKFALEEDLPVRGPVEPGGPCDRVEHLLAVKGGLPAAADKTVFQRQFGLLRHLIHHPFDHPPEHTADLTNNCPSLPLLHYRRRSHLIRLLRECRDVRLSDPRLCESFRFTPDKSLPPEDASFATRAAYALRRRHGSPFGEESDVVADLNWLKLKKQEWQKRRQQADDLSSPHPWLDQDGSIQRDGAESMDLLHACLHALFTQQPEESFDHEPPPSLPEKIERKPPPSLRVYLMQRLADLNVTSYAPQGPQAMEPQVRTLDKDLECLIKGYGFTTIHRTANGQNQSLAS